MVDRVAALGLIAGGAALVCLGEGLSRNLLLLSSNEDPGAVDVLDSSYKEEN